MIEETRMEDIHEPQHVPDGTWVFQVTKGAYRDNTHEKGPEKEGFFMVRAVSPIEVEEDADIDVDILATVFHTIAVWKDRDTGKLSIPNQWQVKAFLLALGLTEDAMAGATLEEASPAAKGRMFTARATTAIREGSDNARTELKGIAAYEGDGGSEI